MIIVTKRNIIFGITGVIYEMHPYNNPKNMDKLMDAINKWLDEKVDYTGNKDCNFKSFKYSNYNELEKELRNVLMGILEFRQLNISRKLYDMGVRDCNDDKNQVFAISTIYDKDTQDKRYSDFIDLDACIRNIINAIGDTIENNEDCFLCKYAKEYGSTSPSNCKECNTCILNPEYSFNREYHPMSLKPKKDWTKEEIEKYNLN